MNLPERVNLTQETINEFQGQDFKWGEYDCGLLAARHLDRLGIKTPYHNEDGEIAVSYRSESGAKKFLIKTGHRSMEAVIDGLGFERIAPASVLPGDLVALPGEGDWMALGVALSNGKALAFAFGVCQAGAASACEIAWRVG